MKLLVFAIIAMFVLIGCHRLVRHFKHPPASFPSSAPAPVIEQTVGSFRPPPAPALPVKQGPAPLAYIVETGGTVRIADADSGVTLAEEVASPASIVSVDEQAGIRVGQDLLVKGPLAGGRTYQIFLENPTENEFRNETIVPGTQRRTR
jgi:hypothetical protein